MAIKISDLTDLETRTVFADGDRMLLSVKDQPVPTQWESRAVEGTILKTIFGAVSVVTVNAAKILQMGTVPVLLTTETFGTDKLIVPQQILMQLTYNGNKYEGNTDIEIGYTNGAVFTASELIRTSETILDSTSDYSYILDPNKLYVQSDLILQNFNIGIQAAGGTQPITGDSTLKFFTSYKVYNV